MAAGNPQNTNPVSDTGGASQSSQSKKTAGKRHNSGSSKKMRAKEQSERFIQTARELEVDKSGQEFEKVARNIFTK